MSDKLPLSHFTVWLASGERGLSSEAIVSVVTGEKVGRYSYVPRDHPHDADDFRRCELLLSTYPEARPYFRALMPEQSLVWAALVPIWDELAGLLETDRPKCGRVIRQILDDARKASRR